MLDKNSALFIFQCTNLCCLTDSLSIISQHQVFVKYFFKFFQIIFYLIYYLVLWAVVNLADNEYYYTTFREKVNSFCRKILYKQ